MSWGSSTMIKILCDAMQYATTLTVHFHRICTAVIRSSPYTPTGPPVPAPSSYTLNTDTACSSP